MTIDRAISWAIYGVGVFAGSGMLALTGTGSETKTIVYTSIASLLVGLAGVALDKWNCKPLEDDTALMEIANEAVNNATRSENLPRFLYTIAGALASPAAIAIYQAAKAIL